jgi:hypothetical protein
MIKEEKILISYSDKYNIYLKAELQTDWIHDPNTQWASFLRHCATSLKVAGLISSGVTGIFH